eukprot:GFUD01138260.1.p1 GENE.GFUD01138260.1~~GFUD01138260.1.p1  ORF type:complete len:428 (-),score=99.14 GFUD01138260.1:41-1267(-)
MENLPTEVLFKIFSCLNVFDQLNISFVCKRFQTIIENEHLPRFLEIDTSMYATNIYYGNNDFISLLDQVSGRFKIKSVRITNEMHKINVAQAHLEEEVVFDFSDCPDVKKQEQFSAKYDPYCDVKNLEKLIHSRGIAITNKKTEKVSQDMFDYLQKNKKYEASKTSQCMVCKTGNLYGKGLVQHLKSKSHNLLTNLKHKNCTTCLENLWSAGFLTFRDLKMSQMFRDLQDMISAKNNDIFCRNYDILRSDGFMENLIVGLLVQTNLNATIEALCIDVKMTDSAMLEMFEVFRCFMNLKKLSLVDFGSDWTMGCMFYEFMKGHEMVCIRLAEGKHDEAFRRFLDEEAQIGLDMQGFPMTSIRRDPDVPEATAFLADEFRFLHCSHAKLGSKNWTEGCSCGMEKFPSWYQ